VAVPMEPTSTLYNHFPKNLALHVFDMKDDAEMIHKASGDSAATLNRIKRP